MDLYSTLIKLVPCIITVGILFFIMYLFEKEASADKNVSYKHFRSKKIRLITVSAAVITIICCLISSILDNDIAYLCFLIGPTIIVSILPLIWSKVGRLVAILLVIFAASGIYLSQSPILRQAQGDLDITLTPSTIEISGIFGETIQLKDINTLRLVDRLPSINLRTFGYSAAGVNRGRFRTKNGHTVWLYTYFPDGQAIRIDTHDGREIYINSQNDLRTKDIFSQIDSLMQFIRQ